MSNLNTLMSSIDICCPYCDHIMEVYDVDVDVTVENYDISRLILGGVSEIKCEDCDHLIKITAQLNIDIAKVK